MAENKNNAVNNIEALTQAMDQLMAQDSNVVL